MSTKLTPEQKSMARALQIQADLACEQLQTVLDSQAISGARRRATVARATMDDAVELAIERKLATARAVLALTASERELLQPRKQAPTKSTTKSTRKSNGKTTVDASEHTVQ